MEPGFYERAERLFGAAALNPDLWRDAMSEFARVSGSVGATMLTLSGRGPSYITTENLEEMGAEYIKGGWYQRDSRFEALPLLLRSGMFTEQDIIPDNRLPKTAYYADFLEKHGTGWGLGLRIDSGGGDVWCLVAQRGTKQGAFQREEQALLRPLAEIISRAAVLARQLGFQRLDQGLAITEQLGDAAFYIDRFGRVARMNARAEAMVTSGRILMRDGRITFPDIHNERLLRHVDAAIWPDLRATDEALLPVAIHQPGRHPLVFRALRIRGDAHAVFAPAYALLVATDLGEQRVVDIRILRDVFKLTPAEAVLTHVLMQTLSLVKAADQLGVSYETARSQLKAVFAKTGTESQLALLRLLQALPQAETGSP
jgi:DNA-binding CsgD family transcriptional regulator